MLAFQERPRMGNWHQTFRNAENSTGGVPHGASEDGMFGRRIEAVLVLDHITDVKDHFPLVVPA